MGSSSLLPVETPSSADGPVADSSAFPAAAADGSMVAALAVVVGGGVAGSVVLFKMPNMPSSPPGAFF